MSDSKSTEEKVKQFMESMGFEETMLGNYSGHGEMVSYDAALLFYQELAERVDRAKLNGALQCLMSLDIGTYTPAGKTIDEEISKIGKALRTLNNQTKEDK